MPDILTDRRPPATPPRRDVAETHWIEWDAPRLGRGEQRALCGAIVASRLHAIEPTCAACREEMTRLAGLEF